MGGSGIEIAATICISIGCLMTCIAVGIPYWEKNDPEDTVNDNIIRHKGIWMKCVTYSTGNWECDDFNKFFLGLPAMLQAARGFGVTAIILGIAAAATIVLGMDSVPCGSDSKHTKRRIRMVAGAMSIIGGFCIIAAASWYANQIRLEYDVETARKITGSNVTRNVFGEALFLGWAGGSLLFLGGLLAICTTCDDSDDEPHSRGYAYRPPVTKHSQEYV